MLEQVKPDIALTSGRSDDSVIDIMREFSELSIAVYALNCTACLCCSADLGWYISASTA